MRAAPAAQFMLAGRRAPRMVAAAIAALAVGGVAAWAARKMLLPDGLSVVVAVAAALLVFALLIVNTERWALSLRWDGRAWHLARPERPIETPGELLVIVDLGPWMLLRFDAGPGAPSQWLSAHQGSVKPRWHALRCAVYSPRPAATPDASVEEAAL